MYYNERKTTKKTITCVYDVIYLFRISTLYYIIYYIIFISFQNIEDPIKHMTIRINTSEYWFRTRYNISWIHLHTCKCTSLYTLVYEINYNFLHFEFWSSHCEDMPIKYYYSFIKLWIWWLFFLGLKF